MSLSDIPIECKLFHQHILIYSRGRKHGKKGMASKHAFAASAVRSCSLKAQSP
uniref:Uncharacterized protein n=1 Tax=Anguilla anguilla TaxID=7936 RepID=A0A0E9UHC8_ANGAN